MACSITSPATLNVEAELQKGPATTAELAMEVGIAESTVCRVMLLLRSAVPRRAYVSGFSGQAPIYTAGDQQDHKDYSQGRPPRKKRGGAGPKTKKQVNDNAYELAKAKAAEAQARREENIRNPHPVQLWGHGSPNALTGKFFTETGCAGC